MGAISAPFRAIDHWDFRFETVEVEAISTAGTPYKRRIEVGMPQIPPEILNSVFYLYKSRADAEAGVNKGGTGFFVSMPSGTGALYVYAVSNWHVAVKHGYSVIRVNTTDGGVDIFDLDPADWFFKPQSHDIAIADAPVRTQNHNFISIHTDVFATTERVESARLGPGEDIFMIGRFVDRDGGSTNVPAVRFGNISVMPQKIGTLTGAIDVESYILDIHSRTGYSGSPVFVYRTMGSDLTRLGKRTQPSRETKMLMLLGIHWGQFPEIWEIKSESDLEEASALPSNAKYVQGWSGMTLASPASAILELLEMPELRKKRVKELKDFLDKRRGLPMAEVADSETSPSSQEPTVEASNLSHKEDFTSLLNAAAKGGSKA
jgi:hypothetical protein